MGWAFAYSRDPRIQNTTDAWITHVHATYTCRFIKKIEIFATKDEQPAGEMGWAFAYCGGARTQYPTKTQRIQSSHVNISKVKNKKYSCTEDEQ